MATLRGAIGALLIPAVSACWTSDEVARVPAPGGRLDAVVVERNGGATTSFGYEVYVVPHGGGSWRGIRVADFYGATRSAYAYGVNPRWTSDHELRVDYLSAERATLRAAEAAVAGMQIRVALRDSVSDPVAPPGGMLYNLQGRPHDPPVP